MGWIASVVRWKGLVCRQLPALLNGYTPAFWLFLACFTWNLPSTAWMVEKHRGYTLHYTASDKANRKEYRQLLTKGIATTQAFFGNPYPRLFSVVIHPDRQSLDSTWQKDWGMPEFKSDCWMVASGIAHKIDVISPKKWEKEACEHQYADVRATQQLITHELVHVYHGQHNASPDFSQVEGLDWFVEGLATYAAGQCDSVRVVAITHAIIDNKVPDNLDAFWTGKLKYGLSGTMVMYLDKQYGRSKLIELLQARQKTTLLSMLHATEAELLAGWKKFMLTS